MTTKATAEQKWDLAMVAARAERSTYLADAEQSMCDAASCADQAVADALIPAGDEDAWYSSPTGLQRTMIDRPTFTGTERD